MLTHAWGLLAHPQREWRQIKEERETLTHLYEHHVLLLAAIPVICSYIGTTQVGWGLGGETTIRLSYLDALGAGIVFYLVILAAVYVVGKVIRAMAKRFTQPPSQSECIVFAGYVATLGIGVLVLEALLGLTVLLWGYGERILLSLLGS